MEHNAPQPNASIEALQKAALERIIYFKNKFHEDGIDVRTGMELKFITEENGQPVKGRINPNGLKDWLRNKHPYIESVLPERLSMQQHATRENAYEYQIIIGESSDTSSFAYQPEIVADTVTKLKDESLAQALLTETCLRTPTTAGMVLAPIFAARPYPDHESAMLCSGTIPLHFSVSLYQNDGNMFKRNHELMFYYAHAIANMQRDAGLALLPNENSLLRLNPDANFIPIIRNLIAEDKGNSVMLRNVNSVEPYLENRMAGADVEPNVLAAVTIAAMYDAYTRLKQDPGVIVEGHNTPSNTEDNNLPRERATWVEALYKKEDRLRELLGKDLFEQIDQHYGTGKTATRG